MMHLSNLIFIYLIHFQFKYIYIIRMFIYLGRLSKCRNRVTYDTSQSLLFIVLKHIRRFSFVNVIILSRNNSKSQIIKILTMQLSKMIYSTSSNSHFHFPLPKKKASIPILTWYYPNKIWLYFLYFVGS